MRPFICPATLRNNDKEIVRFLWRGVDMIKSLDVCQHTWAIVTSDSCNQLLVMVVSI